MTRTTSDAHARTAATESPPTTTTDRAAVHLALPKGRMERSVLDLLEAAGITVHTDARAYRPRLSLPGFATKRLKPQNIVTMLHEGSRDIGFAGADWVAELAADVVELCDTGLDPVRIVAAAPAERMVDGRLTPPTNRPLVVASEYEHLTRRWMAGLGIAAHFVRSYGATEVFPPEDADVVVDNTATGATLQANSLLIVEELMCSSTRLYANPRALDDRTRRDAIEALVVCLDAVLEARRRAMVELNVAATDLDAVVTALPCMRQPTVSTLHADSGYAVRAAVPRSELPVLVPRLKALGATDLVVSTCEQIVP